MPEAHLGAFAAAAGCALNSLSSCTSQPVGKWLPSLTRPARRTGRAARSSSRRGTSTFRMKSTSRQACGQLQASVSLRAAPHLQSRWGGRTWWAAASRRVRYAAAPAHPPAWAAPCPGWPLPLAAPGRRACGCNHVHAPTNLTVSLSLCNAALGRRPQFGATDRAEDVASTLHCDLPFDIPCCTVGRRPWQNCCSTG